MSNTGQRPYEIREHTSVRGKRYFTVTCGVRLILQTYNIRQLQHYQDINESARAGTLAGSSPIQGG
jgi:hypothetical protein